MNSVAAERADVPPWTPCAASTRRLTTSSTPSPRGVTSSRACVERACARPSNRGRTASTGASSGAPPWTRGAPTPSSRAFSTDSRRRPIGRPALSSAEKTTDRGHGSEGAMGEALHIEVALRGLHRLRVPVNDDAVDGGPPWLAEGVRARRPGNLRRVAFSQLLADLESSAKEGIDVARRSNALA